MQNEQIVFLINRTSKPLDIIHDGRTKTIPPGYKIVPDVDPETGIQRVEVVKDEKGKKTERPMFAVVGNGPHGDPLSVPVLVAQAIHGRRQHILRGTQDPNNPAYAETLMACVELGDPTNYAEQNDGLELFDRALLMQVPGTRVDIVHNPHHIANRRSMIVDERAFNVVGINMDYQTDRDK